MLDSEAEYVQQLHILVNNFLRPLRMAASSKKPPITHDDVSSIFLNRWDPLFPQGTFINCHTKRNHLKGTLLSFLNTSSTMEQCYCELNRDLFMLRAPNAGNNGSGNITMYQQKAEKKKKVDINNAVLHFNLNINKIPCEERLRMKNYVN